MTRLANRTQELERFRKMLRGEVRERILLIEAPSGYGKTELMARFAHLCCEHPYTSKIDVVSVDLKAAQNIADVFYKIQRVLEKQRFRKFNATIERFLNSGVEIRSNSLSGDGSQIQVILNVPQAEQQLRLMTLQKVFFEDLQSFNRSIAFILDTFNEAQEELARWIEGNFLTEVALNPKFLAIVAGQHLPKPTIEWQNYHCCCRFEKSLDRESQFVDTKKNEFNRNQKEDRDYSPAPLSIPENSKQVVFDTSVLARLEKKGNLPEKKLESSQLFIFERPSVVGTQIFNFEVIFINNSGKTVEQLQQKAPYLIEEVNGILIEMVVIPGGTFLMGASERKASSKEKPARLVTVQPFLMSKHPVTKAQWKSVAKLPSINCRLNLQPCRRGSEQHPVVEVSWYDAVEFCDRLSHNTGHTYRLPSEAEWEYACRAGTTTPFHFGETITSDLANYDGTIKYRNEPTGENHEKSVAVDSFSFANTFGLFGMHGNVWEWCLDHWHDTYKKAPTDGSAWFKGDENFDRVIRGGSWCVEPRLCCSSSRLFDRAESKPNDTGFRLVRVLQF